MSDATDSLTLEVLVNAADATAQISQVDSGVVQMATSFLKAGDAAKVASSALFSVGESGTKAAAGAKEAATGLQLLTNGLKEVGAESFIVNRGLGALGLEASGAAVKVAGLGEALEGLKKAAPEIIAILIAIEAISKGFDFFKESISDAAALETQMRRLQTAVMDQGGSWDAAKKQIDAFVKSEGELTGFSGGKLRDALNQVENAGHDTADAIQIVTVASDVAKARGMDLVEVTQRITQAEAGRVIGLVQLDPRLRDFIKTHHDMSDILTKLSQDMAGQASNSTHDYEAAVGRLNNAWTEFKEDVGSWLLPWVTSVTDELANMVDQIHIAVSALHTLGTHSGPLNAKGKPATPIGSDPNTGQLIYSPDDVARGDKADFISMDQLLHPGVYAHQQENEAKYLAAQRRKHRVRLDHETQIGKSSGDTAGFSANYVEEDFSSDPTALTKQSQNVAKDVAQRTLAEAALAAQIKVSKTGEEEYAAQIALVNLQVNDAKAEISELTPLHAAEGQQITELTALLPQQKAKLEQLLVAQHAAADAVNGTKKGNEDAKIAYQNATAAVTDAEKQYAKTETTLKSLTSSYAQHGSEIDSAKIKLNAYNEIVAATSRSITAFQTAENDAAADLIGAGGKGFETAIAYWEAVRSKLNDTLLLFHALSPYDNSRLKLANDSIAAIQNKNQITDPAELAKKGLQNHDEIATYGDSLQQQRAYFTQRLAQVQKFGEQYEGQEQELKNKLLDLDKQSNEERIKAHDDFIKNWEGRETEWLDGLITGTKSAKDTLKSIFDDILKDYLAMIEKMIVESAVFKTLNANIASAFGIGGAGGGAGDLGIFAGSSSSSTLPQVAVSSFGPDALKGVTGSSTGVDPLAAGGGGSAFVSAGGSLTIAGFAAVGAGAAAIGSNIGKLEGGGSHDTFGAAGAIAGVGAAGLIAGMGGGIPALLAAGPPGWIALAIGAVAGGALGGLFGSKGVNAHDNPDQDPSTQAAYAAFVANMNGMAGQFGNLHQNPDAQFDPGLGGSSESAQLLNQILAVEQNPNAPPELKAAADSLDKLTNGQTTGNPLAIASEKNGMFTLADGQTVDVATYQAMVAAFQSDSAAAGANGSTGPSFAMTRTYADFNITNPATAVTASPSTGAATGTGNYIDFRGATIVGPDGLSQAINTIVTAMQRAATGQVAGNTNNTNLSNSRIRVGV